MSIKEQFNLIAEEYDTNRKKFIPCFDAYYRSTTLFLTKNMEYPQKIMDLGAGTGLLSSFWYECFPRSEFVLVDIADEMLELAKKRFHNLPNISYLVKDYAKALPAGEFDVIISALSMHHLELAQKKKVLASIYQQLPQNGVFVNYDQFCADTPQMNVWYDRCWEKDLQSSGLSAHDLSRWQERRKLDRECSVTKEKALLEEAGFGEVNCVFSEQKFSVLCAIK